MRRRNQELYLLASLCMAWLAALAAAAARADVLFDQTNLVGVAGVAAPVQYSFTESSAQALVLTLTDEQEPAAFSSLQVAVTLGDALVGSGTVDASTHTATVSIPSGDGTYTVHVIGTPDVAQGIGLFGVCIAASASPSSCIANYSYSGTIYTPSAPSSTPSSALDTMFTTSAAAGTYTVTVTDDAFPVALQSISGGIAQGATAIASLSAGANSVTLAAGTTYTLILGALADATLKAGLYGVQITDPTGATVFDRTVPVGELPAATAVDNPVAQGLDLTLTDEAYPAPLSSLGVAVTEGSSVLAKLTASGTLSNVVGPAGTVQVWQYSVAGTQPGVYSLDLTSTTAGSAPLLSTTQVVDPSGAASTSYAFVVTLPSAGTYTLAVDDFQFPGALQSISATVAQDGAVLTQSATGGFTAMQGVVVVVVDVTPPASGIGVFGVTVQTGGASPQVVPGGQFTQAVGGVFNTQTINLGVAGNFATTLTDLGFPAKFSDLGAVVSSAGEVLGKIYGGGSFDFAATPGTYLLTFIATPSTQNYGLYSLHVASAAPTVTLTASASSVTAGGTVTLTWSSENATSCTASGGSGWTGEEATSGTDAVAVAATETLTLTCTGAGGSAAQSVSVTATPAPSSGGGGAIQLGSILALFCLWAMSAYFRLRHPPRPPR
ncbi:MAG TPA: hypothetical protein VME42_07785 [Steroidobacteraceae bacterium]|nr:hypothetical protein [Steroidobacteraceae bacterium]